MYVKTVIDVMTGDVMPDVYFVIHQTMNRFNEEGKPTVIKRCVSGLLNKPGFQTTAAIAGTMEVEIFPSGTPFANHEMHISDCNKSITLDLDFRDEEELSNTIFKLNQIIDSAKTLKEAAYELHDIYKKAKEEHIQSLML